MYKTIRQTVEFSGEPDTVYGMLMNSEQHSGFTGAHAQISQEVGGEFTSYNGGVSGMNLELVPGKRIVQTWRSANWSEGHHSTVTYEFSKTENGTRIDFTQTGVPADAFDDIDQGWTGMYWSKMGAI